MMGVGLRSGTLVGTVGCQEIAILDITLLSVLACELRTETSMNVSLTPGLEQLVNEKVRSGLYQTASEVPGPHLSR